jgi:hypothetical protein
LLKAFLKVYTFKMKDKVEIKITYDPNNDKYVLDSTCQSRFNKEANAIQVRLPSGKMLFVRPGEHTKAQQSSGGDELDKFIGMSSPSRATIPSIRRNAITQDKGLCVSGSRFRAVAESTMSSYEAPRSPVRSIIYGNNRK